MYKRIILKLSGEAIGSEKEPFDDATIFKIIYQIKDILNSGTQVGVVIGGGNFWRGRNANELMDRTKADQIGMLATVMNAIYIADLFRQQGIEAVVETPIKIGTITEEYSKERAETHLSKGKVVIFAGGIGHPFFSTDTITALRAAELSADGIFFAKNVDGVYDCDPGMNPNAVKTDIIKYTDIIKNDLKVVDLTAVTLCRDRKIPIVIFGLNEEESILKAVAGDKIGTLVTV